MEPLFLCCTFLIFYIFLMKFLACQFLLIAALINRLILLNINNIIIWNTGLSTFSLERSESADSMIKWLLFYKKLLGIIVVDVGWELDCKYLINKYIWCNRLKLGQNCCISCLRSESNFSGFQTMNC